MIMENVPFPEQVPIELEASSFSAVPSGEEHLRLHHYREQLSSAFIRFYSAIGYDRVIETSIIARGDNTLFFTNSTIAALKSRLELPNISQDGLVLSQPCLRTHNLKLSFEDATPIIYNCAFEMLGTLISVSKKENVCGEIIDFLHSVGFSKEQIYIEAQSTDTDFLKEYDKHLPSAHILTDTHPSSYYRWTYGSEELVGRGVTLCIKCSNGIYPIGNVIEILDNDRPIAIECAIGLEALLAAKENLPTTLYASLIAPIFKPDNIKEEKVADLLQATLLLKREGVELGNSAEGHLYKRMVRTIYFLSEESAICEERIHSALTILEQTVWGETTAGIRVLHDLEKVRENIARQKEAFYRKAVKEFVNGKSSREKILEFGLTTYGLSPAVANSLYEQVEREYKLQ